MDAAQLKKTFFSFAAALLLAGAASAQTVVVNPTSVSFDVLHSQVQVTVTGGTTAVVPFTISSPANWFSISSSATSTPATITLTKTGDCSVSSGGCNTKITVTPTGNPGGAVDVSVSNSSTPSGGTGGGQTSTTLTANSSSIAFSATNGSTALVSATPITITTTSSTPISLTAVTDNSNLFVSLSNSVVNSVTSTTLTIFGNPANLSNTTISGKVTVTPSVGTQLIIPITFTIGAGGTGTGVTGTLNATPNPINFSTATGFLGTTVTVTSSTTTLYNAFATVDNGSVAWLLVNNSTVAGSLVPGTSFLFVSANSSLLPAGTYSGKVTLVNANNGADITVIPVTLQVGSGSGSGGSTGALAAPTSLAFSYQAGVSNTPCQQVLLPGTDTYSLTISSGAPFIGSATFTGPTAAQICPVAGQAVGTYTGQLTVQSSSTFQLIPLTLTVSSSTILRAAAGAFGDITCNFVAGSSGCNPVTVNVTASDNTAIPIQVTPSASWITVSGVGASTPNNFTVTIDPSSLPNGLNAGSVSIASGSAANSPLSVPVVVNVSGNAGTGNAQLTLNPTSISLSPSTTTQNLTVSAVNGGSIGFSVSIPSSCPWLSVSQSTGTTQQAITFTANGSSLSSTTTCSVSLSANGVTQALNVTFTPAGPSITPSPSSVTFTTPQNVAPASQTVTITNPTGANITATATTTSPSGGSWLSVTPSSGAGTSQAFTVSVNPAGLQPTTLGAYSGNLTFTAGTTTITVPVTLTVSNAQAVTATPASLTFTYTIGNSAPATQTIQVTGNAASLPFTAQVTSGADWLSVAPTSGSAGTQGTSLTVSVNPASLNASTTPYTGTIVVSGASPATGSTTINVSLTVSAPLPTVTRVTNGASFNTGAIAAGEIITIFGTAMGPSTLTVASPSGNQFPTTLANVQVTIGGFLAPLIYVRNDQIAAVVPYEINRPAFIANPVVLVRFAGQSSNGVNVPQVSTAPGIFTVGGGTGQGAILNSNLSVNSSANPASKGDTVVLYVTGEGQTTPAGTTGRVTPTTAPFAQPASGAVSVSIGGLPAQVTFFGEAPGLIAGVMQINVIVPQGVSSGDVPVIVTVAGAQSQLTPQNVGAATVAVK